MNGDPVFYKVLAVCQILVWLSFLSRYLRLLTRNGTIRWPGVRHLTTIFSSRSILTKFAGAVLMIGLAMVAYGVTTILRQFLGLDYWGRDAVRILSSVLFLAAGVIFHLVLSREEATRTRRR